MADETQNSSLSVSDSISPVIPIQAPSLEALDYLIIPSNIMANVDVITDPVETTCSSDKNRTESPTSEKIQMNISLSSRPNLLTVNSEDSQQRLKRALYYQGEDPWLVAFPPSALKTNIQPVLDSQDDSINEHHESQTLSQLLDGDSETPLMNALEKSLAVQTTNSVSQSQVKKSQDESADQEDNHFFYQLDSSETSDVDNQIQLVTPPSPVANQQEVTTINDDQAVVEILSSSQDEDKNTEANDDGDHDKMEVETVNQESPVVANVTSNDDHNIEQVNLIEKDAVMEKQPMSTVSEGDGSFELEPQLIPAVSDHVMLSSEWGSLLRDVQAFDDDTKEGKWSKMKPSSLTDKLKSTDNDTSNSKSVPSNFDGDELMEGESSHQNGLSDLPQSCSQSEVIDIEQCSVPLSDIVQPVSQPNESVLSQIMNIMSEEDSEPVEDQGGFVIAHSMTNSQPHPQNDSLSRPQSGSMPASNVSSVELLSEPRMEENGTSTSVTITSIPPSTSSGSVDDGGGKITSRGQLCTQLNKKDTTGNITMATPLHSQRPFQLKRDQAQTTSQELLKVSPSTASTSDDSLTQPRPPSGSNKLPPHILKIIQNTWYDHTMTISHQVPNSRRFKRCGLLGISDQ